MHWYIDLMNTMGELMSIRSPKAAELLEILRRPVFDTEQDAALEAAKRLILEERYASSKIYRF